MAVSRKSHYWSTPKIHIGSSFIRITDERCPLKAEQEQHTSLRRRHCHLLCGQKLKYNVEVVLNTRPSCLAKWFDDNNSIVNLKKGKK